MEEDIYKIAKYLIRLYGLKLTNVQSPKDYLYRWMDFRLRYIDPKPRRFHVASHLLLATNNYIKLPWSGLADKVFREIKAGFEYGYDVNKWQSATLLTNDTNHWKPQNSNPRLNRTDLLWADWNIWHFNLKDVGVQNRGQTEIWQMFFMVHEDDVFLIDICKHKNGNEWADKHLLEIANDNWPEYFKPFQIKGDNIKLVYEPSTEEVFNLRKAGINTSHALNNKIFMSPGYGITEACTATRVTFEADKVLDCYLEIINCLSVDESAYLTIQEKRNDENKSMFQLALHQKGLGIYNSKTNSFTPIASRNKSDIIGCLSYLFAPNWIFEKITGSSVFYEDTIYFGEAL